MTQRHSEKERGDVVVVGASASIGESVVRSFLTRGYRVLATYRTTPLALEHPALFQVRLDLRSGADMDRFAAKDLADMGMGSFYGLVMLAGNLPGLCLTDYNDALMDEVMDVNFTGQAKLLQRIAPHLCEGSHILMMASISAERGSFDPLYAASKGAVISFVKSLATWMAPKTRVNALAPGLIRNTAMFEAMAEERRQVHRDRTPMQQLMDPDALGDMIADLFEPHWSHLNGVVVRVNGGAYV